MRSRVHLSTHAIRNDRDKRYGFDLDLDLDLRLSRAELKGIHFSHALNKLLDELN